MVYLSNSLLITGKCLQASVQPLLDLAHHPSKQLNYSI